MIRTRWTSGIALSILLAGCGGGGGSSSTGSGSTGLPDPNPTLEATFRFGSGYTIEQGPLLASIIIGQAGHLTNFGQFAVDLTHRFAKVGGPLSVTARCAFTGTIDMQLDDRDGNGFASPGDVISANLDQCGVPILERKVSGKLRVDVLSIDNAADQAVKLRLTLPDEIRVSWMEGMSIGGIDLNGSLKGSLNAEWSETRVGSQLRVLSSEADDWRTTAVRESRNVTELLRKIDILKRVRYDAASVETTAAFMLDTGSLGGVIQVTTPKAFAGNPGVSPRQFLLQAGLADYLLKIEPASVLPGATGRVSLVNRATQVITPASSITLEDFPLVSDVRAGLWGTSFGTQGGGVRVLLPWQSERFQSTVDRACAQQTGAGVFDYTKADALFQRPVATRSDLSQAEATVPLQFGRAVADGSPTLQFRFADTSPTSSARLLAWHVAATADRQGASYVIRPMDTLRQGREYQLEASLDGQTWGRPIEVKDAQGAIIWSSSTGFLTQIYMPSLMRVDVSKSPALIADAGKPIRLQTRLDIKSGTTISTHKWEQLSGPRVQISDSTIAEPLISYADAVTQPVSAVVLQHTLTDTQGHQEKTRLRLLAGAVSAQGALFAWDQGFDGMSSGQDAVQGLGSVFVEDNGSVLSKVVDGNQTSLAPVFSIAAPSGSPLQLGTYENVVRSLTPKAQPTLWTHVLCEADNAPSTNAFTILDIGRDSDGRLNRLAVDFTQRCETGHRDFIRGSYRFNSVVPVVPSP